jgi:hypothetical protein
MSEEVDYTAEEIENAKKVLRGGAGEQLLHAAASYVVPVFWGHKDSAGVSRILHSATAFFLECGGPTLVLTAAHVFREYEADQNRHQNIVLQLGEIRFRPEPIAVDDHLDIATFLSPPSVPERLKKWVYRRSQATWPPPPPEQGKGVFFAGFPALYRDEPAPDEARFGLYGGLVTATSVKDDHIVCQLRREYLEDILGHGLPPKNAWLGGISGAPGWTLTSVGWRLAGIIYEFSQDYELFYMRRPESIRADGTIR